VAHGFSNRPRFVCGYYATASADLDLTSATYAYTLEDSGSGTNVVYIQRANNANIQLVNSAASGSWWFRVFAML
jgi:hypothetical protein